MSSEEKGERSNHGDVSLAAARWLVVKGLEGVERLLQTLLCKQNEPDSDLLLLFFATFFFLFQTPKVLPN